MDDFLEGLTIEDWKSMTEAEWEAFLMDSEIEELVEFIHEMHSVDRKVVYDMFKFMPHDMLEDFKQAPELSREFSETEMETIKHAVDANVSRKESLMDEPVKMNKSKKMHKNRKGKQSQGGKGGHKKGGHKKGGHKKSGH
mgnify:CR=1 FL=1